jgi:hypothetical protein
MSQMVEAIWLPHGRIVRRQHEQRSSVLLGGAAVLSAFLGPQFRIGDRLFVVDLVVGVLIVTAILGYRPRRNWVPARLVLGVALISVGLLIAALVEGGLFPASLADLARDILPPVAFAAAVSLHPKPCHYSRQMAIAVSLTGAVAVASLLSSGDGRRTAFLDDPNYAGHFVVISWIVFAGLWSGPRVVRVVTFLITVLAVVRTGSFSALAGLAGLAAYLMTRWKPSDLSMRALARLLIAVAFGVTALLSVRAIGQSDFDLGNGTESARLDRSYSSRTEIWSNSVGVFVDKPLGIGASYEVDGVPLRDRLGAGEPHNDLLTMLVRGGLLAVLGEVLVIIALWKLLPPSSWSRSMLAFWLISAMSRQTWNFRHYWLSLAILYLLEEASRLRLSSANTPEDRQ